jgi:hypothetical protein
MRNSQSLRRFQLACVLPAILVCVAGSPSFAAKGETRPGTVRPLAEISGAYSKIATRFYITVTSEKEWNRIWAKHTGQSDAVLSAGGTQLHVDFDRYMVVAVFQGEQQYNLGVVAQSIDEGMDKLTFRFTNKWVSAENGVPSHTGNPYTPFGIFVIPRVLKEVVMEEAVYGAKGQAPTYAVRARFNLATPRPGSNP